MIQEALIRTIGEDLAKRRLKLTAVVCATPTGRTQVLGYDSEGIVRFISDEAGPLVIYERLGGRAIRPVAEVHAEIAVEDFPDGSGKAG